MVTICLSLIFSFHALYTFISNDIYSVITDEVASVL